jgi:predicted MPP superfamily phosphohydrolase
METTYSYDTFVLPTTDPGSFRAVVLHFFWACPPSWCSCGACRTIGGVKVRLSRMGYALSAMAIATLIQIPMVLTIGHLSGERLKTIVLAALLLLPSAAWARNPWEHRPRSRLELYLVMWPFFVWWVICAAFLGFAAIGLLVAALTTVTVDSALKACIGLGILGGLHALGRWPRIRRIVVPVAGLPEAFVGYRVVQLSDVHCGPFTPAPRIRKWVERANKLGGDVITVTGDLITSGAHYVPTVAQLLSGLRAPDGIYGCMGNHDYFTDGDAFARELDRAGLPILRNSGVVIERDGARLYLAGVDDTWTRRNDMERALKGRPPGAPVVLMAHDPVLFPEAAGRGVALTLSGHTHGGQFTVPVFPRSWNIARVVSPYILGTYRLGPATLYVNRGLGTTGPPIRLGAPPEIAVFTLVPAPAHDQVAELAEEVIRDASDAGPPS